MYNKESKRKKGKQLTFKIERIYVGPAVCILYPYNTYDNFKKLKGQILKI